jgi:hypothetical protein
MGWVMEDDDISISKACIRDASRIEDLGLPLLFNKGNEVDLWPIPSFLPKLIIVEELLITMYTFIYKSSIYTTSNIAILVISTALARTHQRLGDSYYGYLLNLID